MQRDKIKPIPFSIIKHSGKEEPGKQLPRDIVSGIMVAVVALPLSIASGVSPEKGLCTAIVAGVLIMLMGFSNSAPSSDSFPAPSPRASRRTSPRPWSSVS